MGFPGRSDCKESACNAEDLSSVPELGRSPGGGHGTPVFLPGESPWTEESGRLQWVINSMPVTLPWVSKSPYRSLNWGLSPVTGILAKRPQLGIYHTASSRNIVSRRLLGAHDQQIYQPFLIPVVE